MGNDKPTVVDGTLTCSVWWKPTERGMMYNRDSLDYDHPQQTYNYLKSYGIRPEDFGIKHPLVEIMMREYVGKSREDLIVENMQLKKDLEAAYRAGF